MAPSITELILVCKLFELISSREICYENYGCFTTEDPFGGTYARPLALLPEHPETINTKFNLYSRDLNAVNQFISATSFNENFNKSLPSKVIVDRFFNTPELNNWMGSMKEAIMQAENANVMIAGREAASSCTQ